MASTGIPETLVVPKILLQDKPRFGMDIGGSLIKVAYWTEDGEDAHIQFKSYTKEKLPEALLELKQELKFKEGELITTTGIGCHQFRPLIQQTLGVRTRNIIEMDCFVDALKFMVENRPLEDFIYPPSEKGLEMYASYMKMVDKFMEKLPQMDTNMDKTWTPPEEKEAEAMTKYSLDDVFPCLLCMIGSGAGYMKVEKDGKTSMIDGTPTAGRMLLGLGSLLAGVETFDELVSLAEVGDASNVEVQCKDLKNKSGENDPNDVYALMVDEMPVYGFGHAVGKKISDFKKEDLAAATIVNVAQTIAITAHLANLMANVKMILFCGSVCGQSSYIRDEISKMLETRCRLNLFNINKPYHFLKYGGYLGALGTIIRGQTTEDTT